MTSPSYGADTPGGRSIHFRPFTHELLPEQNVNDKERALRTVAATLRNRLVVEFVTASVKAGYREFYGGRSDEVCGMVEQAFDRLARGQRDGVDSSQLAVVATSLRDDTFKKSDPSFWFNRIYHQYKTEIKPEADFQQLRNLLPGKRILDYGCGSGYLAARLAKGGYEVFTTDVLDYRYPEARHLPFSQMTTATDFSYPDDSADVALVLAVLHHINPDDLARVIQRLRKISRYLLIKEDTYGLPDQVEGLAESLARQPLLRTFAGMTLEDQQQVLVLIDFYSNAIAQGIPEMNMPFEFKTVTEWKQIFLSNGFNVNRSLVAGFEAGRMHKSCHVWLVCERLVQAVEKG